MVEFSWKLKDSQGKIYTRKHLPVLMRAYRCGEIADGDLFFQSDETKPWVEIRNLKILFQGFEKGNILKAEKVVDKKVLDARILHITFLLFIFIIIVLAVIYLGVSGGLLPFAAKEAVTIRSKVLFVIGTLVVFSILLFLPLALFYSCIFRWKEKVKKYFLQQEENKDEENSSLQAVGKLAKNLRSSLQKNSLIRVILSAALKTSKFSAGFLLLHNYQLNRMVYEAGAKIDRTMFKKAEYAFDEPPIKKIVRDKEIVWLADIGKKEFNYFLRPEKIPVLEKNHSLILIPLVVEQELLGILGLYGRRGEFIRLKLNPSLSSILKDQVSLALGSAIQSELAILDRLTGLLNHEYFMKRLNEEIERSRRFNLVMSFLMLDLDHFKRINDTYGHQAGDLVLKSAAAILKENIRIVDFCGRYGGEEFAVVLIDTDLEGARVKAEQLRTAIEKESFAFEGQSLKFTVSLGISVWKRSDNKDLSLQDLIKISDKELYRAKKEGRNRTCFTVDNQPLSLP